MHLADGDFDGEALLRTAAEPESFGEKKTVGPEVELVRLDESGVSQAVVAEAPAGPGAAAKATETVARRDVAADADADDIDADDADDETRLLRGPVTTDAVVVRTKPREPREYETRVLAKFFFLFALFCVCFIHK